MINDDKFLREILANGIEQPSANFTAKVLKEVEKAQIKKEQQVEIPSTLIWMSVLFPILALTVSLEPVYRQISIVLKLVGLESVITQSTIIYVSLAILAFSLIDIFLLRRFVKHEHQHDSKGKAFLSI